MRLCFQQELQSIMKMVAQYKDDSREKTEQHLLEALKIQEEKYGNN